MEISEVKINCPRCGRENLISIENINVNSALCHCACIFNLVYAGKGKSGLKLFQISYVAEENGK